MQTETTYWTRRSKILTRRHLLGRSLAAGAGLAGLGLVGCGGSSNNNGQPAKPTTATVATAPGTPSGGAGPPVAGTAAASTRAAAATGAASPSVAAGPPPKPGGVGLVSGTPAVWDTFDTDRSNFSTNLAVFNTTFDRIINW